MNNLGKPIALNKWVFKSDLKLDRKSAFLIWLGIEFLYLGAAMEKARSP